LGFVFIRKSDNSPVLQVTVSSYSCNKADFVQFLKSKHLQNKLEISAMSEAVLAKDWLRPEEDEAWQDL